MKVNNLLLYTTQNRILPHFKSQPDTPSNQEAIEIRISETGTKYAKVDIFDKPHRFILNEEITPENLRNMIENIEKTMTGYFIRQNRHEYFIPHVLKKVPNISNYQYLIENGNTATELNKESEDALKIIEAHAKETLDIKDLKTIKYLRKTIDGYANNTIEKAFGYLDKINNDLYLYIPKNNRMQILTNDYFVKNIRL